MVFTDGFGGSGIWKVVGVVDGFKRHGKKYILYLMDDEETLKILSKGV